jgi:hypothetical protein
MVLFVIVVFDVDSHEVSRYYVRNASEPAKRLADLGRFIHISLDMTTKDHGRETAAQSKGRRTEPPTWKLHENADVQWLIDAAGGWFYDDEGEEPEGIVGTFSQKRKDVWDYKNVGVISVGDVDGEPIVRVDAYAGIC